MSPDPALDAKTVGAWFDDVYARKGFRYLRPIESYEVFLDLLDLPRGARILDLACGPGLLLELARERGLRPVGVDLSQEALLLGRRRFTGLPLVRGSADRIPLPDAVVDAVTCIGALERMIDRPRVLAELRRVARPSSRLCVMVRNSETLTWLFWNRLLGRQNLRGHQDALSKTAWQQLFLDAGFSIEAIHRDQWPLQRIRRAFSRKRRDLRGRPISRGWLPLRFANEFIFVLRAPA